MRIRYLSVIVPLCFAWQTWREQPEGLVASTTAPGSRAARRSLLGMLLTTVLTYVKPRGGTRKVADLVAVAREHVLTVAALSAMDLGGFQVLHHGGWFVVAASLVMLDFAVTGR